jgi:hypothetical protein
VVGDHYSVDVVIATYISVLVTLLHKHELPATYRQRIKQM